MSHYLLEYRYADQEERARVRPEHLTYMQRLHAEGSVVLAGPLADDTGAVVVLRASDEAEARRLVARTRTPARASRPTSRLREWRVVVPGD
jgi:uncharacterized protein YciI